MKTNLNAANYLRLKEFKQALKKELSDKINDFTSELSISETKTLPGIKYVQLRAEMSREIYLDLAKTIIDRA